MKKIEVKFKKAQKHSTLTGYEEKKQKTSKNCSSISIERSECSFEMDQGRSLDTEYDSEPDRSDPQWKLVLDEKIEKEPSVLENIKEEKKPTLWEQIMIEYEDKRLEFDNIKKLEKPYEPPLPQGLKLSASQYLEKHIFPFLCPILEETLVKAKEYDCLMIQKSRFNGLDYISELLWNRNPLHPHRHKEHREIFDIPFVVIHLYHHPRPIYPLSWLWTKDEAIVVLQSYIRRYLVCKEVECSEMRQFWKILKREQDEKYQLEKEKFIEDLEIMFNEILDQLVANAVFEAEWKKHGCHCVKTPCTCLCLCMKWCKCCKCYKMPEQDYSSCDCLKPE